jgi:c(7)-type cytochrome triheme protein
MRSAEPLLAAMLVALGLLLLAAPAAQAEYGDVVLNRRSEANGVRPVVFPHWFHRIRFRCKVCHSELGFTMRAGANDVKMDDITQGRFCCDLCHSGLPGLKSGIVGGHGTSGPGKW